MSILLAASAALSASAGATFSCGTINVAGGTRLTSDLPSVTVAVAIPAGEYDVVGVSADVRHSDGTQQSQTSERWRFRTDTGFVSATTPDLGDHEEVASFSLGRLSLNESVSSITFEHQGDGTSLNSVQPSLVLECVVGEILDVTSTTGLGGLGDIDDPDSGDPDAGEPDAGDPTNDGGDDDGGGGDDDGSSDSGQPTTTAPAATVLDDPGAGDGSPNDPADPADPADPTDPTDPSDPTDSGRSDDTGDDFSTTIPASATSEPPSPPTTAPVGAQGGLDPDGASPRTLPRTGVSSTLAVVGLLLAALGVVAVASGRHLLFRLAFTNAFRVEGPSGTVFKVTPKR